MRLPDQDHPLVRVAEIGEIGIVARIFDVQIDLDVDQRVALRKRLSLDDDAEFVAHRAATAITGKQITGIEDLATCGRLKMKLHSVRVLNKIGKAMIE